MPTLTLSATHQARIALTGDPAQDHKTSRASMLDRLADAELQQGHHLAAERLSWHAAEMREAAP